MRRFRMRMRGGAAGSPPMPLLMKLSLLVLGGTLVAGTAAGYRRFSGYSWWFFTLLGLSVVLAALGSLSGRRNR